MSGELIPTSELSRRLGLSERTLQRYRRTGVLKPELVSPGGHARWVEADVREQLRELAEAERNDK